MFCGCRSRALQIHGLGFFKVQDVLSVCTQHIEAWHWVMKRLVMLYRRRSIYDLSINQLSIHHWATAFNSFICKCVADRPNKLKNMLKENSSAYKRGAILYKRECAQNLAEITGLKNNQWWIRTIHKPAIVLSFSKAMRICHGMSWSFKKMRW